MSAERLELMCVCPGVGGGWGEKELQTFICVSTLHSVKASVAH